MEEKQKNLLKAIGASLGVALVGAVLWGVLYQFGAGSLELLHTLHHSQ